MKEYSFFDKCFLILRLDKLNKKFLLIFLVVLFSFSIIFFFLKAPNNFPVETTFHIESGSTLRTVSLNLKDAQIIRSRMLFEALVIIFSGDRRIISSDYFFKNKISVIEVARRISKGDHRLNLIKITIPEGFSVNEINTLATSKLPYFNQDKFLVSASELEGYLFPDTYFFYPTATELEVIKTLNNNFKKKIITLEQEINESGKSESDIIKMASVIEKEARGDDDREVISGILWKRLSIKMPLQVDAAPETYKTRGLPEKPITNPGLLAIRAAIHPKASPYLYYLHDKNGDIHYAKSFTEHQRNINKYLK